MYRVEKGHLHVKVFDSEQEMMEFLEKDATVLEDEEMGIGIMFTKWEQIKGFTIELEKGKK